MYMPPAQAMLDGPFLHSSVVRVTVGMHISFLSVLAP